jgi:hypothetical protein
VSLDSTPAEEGAPRPAVAVRCESCGSVVSTTHPWDTVTCACGRLTVSGRPWQPTIAWLAAPGSGWSTANEDDGDAGDGDTGAGDESDADVVTAQPPRRPIGYLP